uniref:Uncharacterized protein n=1 Tax=Arundo donax TaxID=35708 RepID=A0A0A8Z8U2_ARUDO
MKWSHALPPPAQADSHGCFTLWRLEQDHGRCNFYRRWCLILLHFTNQTNNVITHPAAHSPAI